MGVIVAKVSVAVVVADAHQLEVVFGRGVNLHVDGANHFGLVVGEAVFLLHHRLADVLVKSKLFFHE